MPIVPQSLPSGDIESGSEDEWDDIEEEAPTQAQQMTSVGAIDDGEPDDSTTVDAEVAVVDSEAPLEAPVVEMVEETSMTAKASPAERTTVSWDIVSKFSFEAMRRTYLAHAPTTWHVLSKFVAPKPLKKRPQEGQFSHRPKWIVSNTRSF